MTLPPPSAASSALSSSAGTGDGSPRRNLLNRMQFAVSTILANQSWLFSHNVILLLVGNGAGTRRSITASRSTNEASTCPTSVALRQCLSLIHISEPTRQAEISYAV